MGKCVKCGRKGLFFKVNSDGLCAECADLGDISKHSKGGNTISVLTHRKSFTSKMIETLGKRYIAFDVETTGLNPDSDRIIELGAVLFENGVPKNEYGSLVNAKVHIPISASKVNHITDEMISSAPSEEHVYAKLVNFLGDALSAKTVICAHNADFDMSFLSNTLKRIGYNAEINYVDTLSLSRKSVFGVQNYKLPTLARHFGIVNEQAHRAVSDAQTCGQLLAKLINNDSTPYPILPNVYSASKPVDPVDISVLLKEDDVRQAAFYVVDTGKATTANIMASVGVGFSRAARILDKLEGTGIIGPFEGTTSRRVLVDRDWLNQKLEECALENKEWVEQQLASTSRK